MEVLDARFREHDWSGDSGFFCELSSTTLALLAVFLATGLIDFVFLQLRSFRKRKQSSRASYKKYELVLASP